MGKWGFTGAGIPKGTLEARALSLALCLALAGCGAPARQPDAAHLPAGAYRVHAALPGEEQATSCESLYTPASPAQAVPGGPWDAATIEHIRRSLGYAPP